MMRRWEPQTRYTLQRITASVLKDLTRFDLFEKLVDHLLLVYIIFYFVEEILLEIGFVKK